MFFLETVIIILAYLIGSFSTAVIVAKKCRLADPRSYGSGNPGATNVLRSGRKDAAAYTLAGDVLKGVLAVLVARIFQSWLGMDFSVVAWSGVAVVVGHMWPLFFGFKGGKGVATALGVLLVLSWPTALWCLAIWAGVAYKFKKSSLAALLACASALLFGFVYAHTPVQGWAVFVIALLVICRHRDNICRLISGTEPGVAVGSADAAHAAETGVPSAAEQPESVAAAVPEAAAEQPETAGAVQDVQNRDSQTS